MPEWRRSKMVVLFKKGDPTMSKYYRPIAIIPVLAKLYSSSVLSRVRANIDQALPCEQAGFRKGMDCADQLHALMMCAERAHEWGCTLWVASLNLELKS